MFLKVAVDTFRIHGRIGALRATIDSFGLRLATTIGSADHHIHLLTLTYAQ